MVTLDQGGRGRSTLYVRRPDADLASVIEHVWVQLSPEAAPSERAWRIVADDAPHLVGQCTSSGVRLVLVGARTTFADADVSRRHLTVGVRLRPGTLPALFDVSAEELTDRAAPLADVLGCAPAEVHDALAARDGRATVRALGTFLADRARTRRPVDARITDLVRAGAGTRATVREAASALALSERTARHWSRQHVGMGMKRLWRIRRLHRALQLGLRWPAVGWARVAAEAGYADQSHLVRDCRALLGETPTAFAARGDRG